MQFLSVCPLKVRLLFWCWLFDEPLRLGRLSDSSHLCLFSDEVEGGGAGLFSGCGDESPLRQSAVQTSEGSGKTRQQKGVPGRWDAPPSWRVKCWLLSALLILLFIQFCFPLLLGRRHGGVHPRGLPEPTEHAAGGQGPQAVREREGQRQIQGKRPLGQIFQWHKVELAHKSLCSVRNFFLIKLCSRTVNPWCLRLSSSNPTSVLSPTTSSRSRSWRGRRKMKTRTKRERLPRSLRGQEIFACPTEGRKLCNQIGRERQITVLEFFIFIFFSLPQTQVYIPTEPSVFSLLL